MVVTQFGRVEFDPLRVPVAANAKSEAGASFADRLDRLVRDDADAQAAEVDATQDDAFDSEEHEASIATDDRDEIARDHEQPAEHDSDRGAEDAFRSDDLAAPVAANNELPARATAVRHESAGKGADVVLEASHRRDVVAPGLSAPTAAGATTVISFAAPAGGATGNAVDGIAAAQKSGSVTRAALERLHAEMPQLAQRAVAGESKTLGYRTLNAQAVQLNEQARDSVFKQILFKLGKDGGEMRMRLDPPEFGELDLRMTVENGNSLRLSIGTERADLRDLLLAGLDQLKKELEQSGLTVTHADVHTRQGDKGDGESFAGSGQDKAQGETEGDASSAAPARAGWITAQGLDFWV